MAKQRIPDHIHDIAKNVVVLSVEIQNENRLLEEEISRLNVRRTRIMALQAKMFEEEQRLVDECREWIKNLASH